MSIGARNDRCSWITNTFFRFICIVSVPKKYQYRKILFRIKYPPEMYQTKKHSWFVAGWVRGRGLSGGKAIFSTSKNIEVRAVISPSVQLFSHRRWPYPLRSAVNVRFRNGERVVFSRRINGCVFFRSSIYKPRAKRFTEKTESEAEKKVVSAFVTAFLFILASALHSAPWVQRATELLARILLGPIREETHVSVLHCSIYIYTYIHVSHCQQVHCDSGAPHRRSIDSGISISEI